MTPEPKINPDRAETPEAQADHLSHLNLSRMAQVGFSTSYRESSFHVQEDESVLRCLSVHKIRLK